MLRTYGTNTIIEIKWLSTVPILPITDLCLCFMILSTKLRFLHIFVLKPITINKECRRLFSRKNVHFQWRQSFVFASFWKGVYSEWKVFAPYGSKLFPFKEDPAQVFWCWVDTFWFGVQEDKETITNIVRNGRNSIKCIQSSWHIAICIV